MKYGKFYFYLIAILMMVISCGSGDKAVVSENNEIKENTENLKKAVGEIIPDQKRKDKIFKLVDESSSVALDLFDLYKDYLGQMKELSYRYDTSKEQFDNSTIAYEKKFKEYMSIMIEKRREMRSILTEKEWQNIDWGMSLLGNN